MNLLFALMIAIVFGSGVYCLMRRCLMRIVVGLVLISQAANLVVFTAAGLTVGAPAFVRETGAATTARTADPLAQALVLTAIVIGFGLTVFAFTLLFRAHRATGSDDMENFNRTDAL